MKKFSFRRILSPGTAIFLFVFLALFLSTRGEYGYGDDYVILGIAKQSGFNFLAIFNWFTNLSMNAGRSLGAVFQGIAYSALNDVGSLGFIRLVSALGWALCATYLYRRARDIGFRLQTAIVMGSVIVLIPGVAFLTILTAGFIYAWGTLFALFLSWRISQTQRFDLSKLSTFVLMGLAVSSIYQPILNVIPLFSILVFVKEKDLNRIILNKICISSSLIYICLALNFIYIRFFLDSQRISGSINLGEKLKLAIESILPMIVFPQYHLLFSHNQIIPIMIILAIAIYIILANKQMILGKGKFIDVYAKKTLLILLSFGYMPVTLIWLLLIPENTVDYRRILWAGLMFWLITLTEVMEKILLNSINWVFIVIGFLTCLIWLNVVRASTVQLQIDEWSAAKCASSSVALKSSTRFPITIRESKINSRFKPSTDEFARSSMFYPGPQTFMPWLANDWAGNTKIPVAWGMYAGQNPTLEGLKWVAKFRKCMNDIK